MLEVDARGLSCPIPVVRTKSAMDKNPQEPISVLLDSEVSLENVTRLAQSLGYEINLERSGDEYRLNLTPASK
ncbi:MAG TPA: sulfurtransferase TusA family protein [Syntrophomonadaceae bacterium]|jgi:tRNA 2-thiouridine synthesizing protein A|nr:sulfurtransferase TusA family protein [Syntrophomonadaceae bacterium]